MSFSGRGIFHKSIAERNPAAAFESEQMASDLYISACAAGRMSAAEMLVILLTGEKNLH